MSLNIADCRMCQNAGASVHGSSRFEHRPRPNYPHGSTVWQPADETGQKRRAKIMKRVDA